MKHSISVIAWLLSSVLTHTLYAQAKIEDILQNLDKILVEIEAGKEKMDPSVSSDKKSPCTVTFNITNTDAKGKTGSLTYEIGLSDLSPQLLKATTKSNVRYVEVATKDRSEFIKFTKDNEFKGYVGKFELPTYDNDAAKDIIDIIKSAIATCETMPDVCPKLKSFSDATSQLLSLITKVSIDETQFDQQIRFDAVTQTHATFSVKEIGKSKTVERDYTFDFADFADNKVKFSIAGKQLKVNIVSRVGDLVQRTEGGKCQNLTDDTTFLAANIEEAKCLLKTLQSVITLSRDLADNRLPDVKTAEEALSLAAKQVQSFEQCTVNRQQAFVNQCLTTYTATTTTEGGKKKEEQEWAFNFLDINSKSIEIKTSGNTIAVKLKTTDNENFIKNTKNGEIQNYDNEVLIPTPDGESAKLLMYALRKAVKLCPQSAESDCDKTGVAALGCAVSKVKDIKQGQNTVNQKLERLPDNDFKLRLTVKTEKGSKTEEINSEWNLKDIDSRKSALKVSGKEVAVQLVTKGNEKIIKVNKGDKSEYSNKLNIDVEDIESGRALLQIFQKSLE